GCRVGAEGDTPLGGGRFAGSSVDWVGGLRSRVGPVGGAGQGMGVVMASWAALANSTVVAYRWAGSLAMPVAITLSNCAGTSGWVADGCGGGVCRCAATSCAIVASSNGGCPV